MNVLEIKHLTHKYNDGNKLKPVLNDIDLKLESFILFLGNQDREKQHCFH